MRYGLRKSVQSTAALLLLTGVLAGCVGRSSGNKGEGGAAASPTHATNSAPMPSGMAQAGGTASHAVPNQITIDNFRFNPSQLTVAVGTKVTWVNRDDVPHTATSTARPQFFDSHTLDTDDQFAHVFTAPGTYDYFCAVHPHMTGRIIVK